MNLLRSTLISSLAIMALVASPLSAQESTASTPAKEVAKTVTFKTAKIVVGDKIIMTGSTSVSQNMTVQMEEQVVMDNKSTLKTTTRTSCVVKAAKDGAPTSLSITFNKIEIDEDNPMAEQMGQESSAAELLALNGKSYLMDLSAAPAKVTDLKGEAVPEGEAKSVRERFISNAGKFVGFGPNLSKVVPDGDMKVGTKIDLTPDLLGDILGMTKDDDLGDPKEFLTGSMTLTGTRTVLGNVCGVFDIKIKFDGTPDLGEDNPMGEMKVSGDPTGKILVGLKNKWVYRSETDGDMNINGEMDQGEMVMTLIGKVKLKSLRVAIFTKEKAKAAK